MIVYNLTVNIDESVYAEWVKWMKENHIPDVMRTGMFSEYRFLKVLGDEESGGHTYSIQYVCENMEKFRQYEDVYAPSLRGDHNARFKDKFISFRTLLSSVD